MSRKNGKRNTYILIGVAIAMLVGGVFAVSAFMRGGAPLDPARLAKVDKGDLAKSVVATGKIEAITKVQVKSKASGIVETLNVQFGDTVKTGQILAELDKDQLEARVRELTARQESEKANFQAALASYERNKIEAVGPDLPFLKRQADRYQSMLNDGIIPPQTLEDAQKNFEMALNRQRSAQSNLSVDEAKIAQARAQVAQATAALQNADEDLRNSTIRAPIDGIVLSRDVEIGDAVSSILVLGSNATLVMTLGDTSEVYVKGKVDESDIGRVFLDQPARITVESFKDKKFTGKVTKLSPLGVEKDNVTTFEVRVSILNPGGELRVGMTANAEIVLEEHKDALRIPEAAILYDAQRNASVETLDPNQKSG
ncbi:MAG: efflux RND transporter periplasmic adaptor subunit, partial [Acidobacteria bacterium]|nr:efflux RND transporter periplasmic adaptor subunit [Acidobacteriota bacterium]